MLPTFRADADAVEGVRLKLTPMVDGRRPGEGRSSKSIAGEGGATCDRRGNVTGGGGSMRCQLPDLAHPDGSILLCVK